MPSRRCPKDIYILRKEGNFSPQSTGVQTDWRVLYMPVVPTTNAFRSLYILPGRAVQKPTRTGPSDVLHPDPALLFEFAGFFTLGDRASKRKLEPLGSWSDNKTEKKNRTPVAADGGVSKCH